MTGFEQEDVLQVYSSANYTYARAQISFTRSPDVIIQAYLVPSLLFVFCSYFGFFIDPMATPARVALGMLTIVVSANNYLGLTKQLPTTLTPPWIARLVLLCLYFNVIGARPRPPASLDLTPRHRTTASHVWQLPSPSQMVGVVVVSFGSLSKKWLKAQEQLLDSQLPWRRALGLHTDKLVELFHSLDADGNGYLSKKEFRRGIEKMHLVADKVDVNGLFDQYDVDNDDRISQDELEMMLKDGVFEQPRRSSSGASAEEAQEEAAANDMDPDEDAGANQTNAEREERKSAKGRRPSLTSPSRDFFYKPTSSGARVVPVVSATPKTAAPKDDADNEQHSRMDPPTEDSATRVLSSEKLARESFTAVRSSYRHKAAEDLDMGPVWMCVPCQLASHTPRPRSPLPHPMADPSAQVQDICAVSGTRQARSHGPLHARPLSDCIPRGVPLTALGGGHPQALRPPQDVRMLQRLQVEAGWGTTPTRRADPGCRDLGRTRGAPRAKALLPAAAAFTSLYNAF